MILPKKHFCERIPRITVRRLSQGLNPDIPLRQKYFCMDRVFRNEKVDWKHLAEFQQIEGIVIGENMPCFGIGNCQIVEFYHRMGFKKIYDSARARDTEPSMEIAVFWKSVRNGMQLQKGSWYSLLVK